MPGAPFLQSFSLGSCFFRLPKTYPNEIGFRPFISGSRLEIHWTADSSENDHERGLRFAEKTTSTHRNTTHRTTASISTKAQGSQNGTNVGAMSPMRS